MRQTDISNLPLFSATKSPNDQEAHSDTALEKGLQQCRDIIINSPAYAWLLSSIRRDQYLMPSQPNLMGAIRQEIISSMLTSSDLSTPAPLETYKMTFITRWDLQVFLEEREFAEDPEHVIHFALSLTGSTDLAQALPCGQYMSQTWPETGTALLRLICEVVHSPDAEKERESSVLTPF